MNYSNISNTSTAAERGHSRPTIRIQAGRAIASSNVGLSNLVLILGFVLTSSLRAKYDYADIAPIFDQYCVKCHGPDKQKSKFRLDTYKQLLTPGSSDEVPIAPFYPMQSPLVEYLLLPKSDEYAMPPEDEDTPNADEVLKIVHWIYHGAQSEGAKRWALPLEETLNDEQTLALNQLRERGAIIHKRGSSDAGLVSDLQQLSGPISEMDLNSIRLLPNIEELRLPGLAISKSILEGVSDPSKLKRLDLRMSDLDDKLLSDLNRFKSLEYLNLFGTGITDTGLSQLDVPQSGRLYLGDTQVSEDAKKIFLDNHPDVAVAGTVNLEAVIKITEMAQNNSTTFHPGEKKEEPKKTPTIPTGSQISDSGIRHSFLVCGRITAIFNEDSEVVWSTPGNARDGMVLENGNVLLSIGGEAREYLKGTQSVIWSYKLDSQNKELGTVNRLQNGNTLVVERGVLPRLLEIDDAGAIVVDVPLQPETDNNHMQTRMARKLPNGNYLVPHLLAFKVKEYSPKGDIVRVIKTDVPKLGGLEAENWPFTAILLPNGNTLVNLTHGNKSVEFGPDGSVAWVCDNEDVGDRFRDPCGGQRLPNGNTVIGSYGQKDGEKVKLFEVNQDKEVVWEFFHPTVKAHEVHILTTNGKPVVPVYR